MVSMLNFFHWVFLCSLLLASSVSSKHNGNTANDLVEIINKNRTASKIPQLYNSPGLGCIALQYARVCTGNCSSNSTIKCQPSEDDFTEVFAPNCGVELPTFGTISGYLLGCHQGYLEPSEAFVNVLVRDKKTLSSLRNRTHTEVGVGIIKAHKHKGPYIWCVLFSNSQTNTSFVLDDLGQGIKQTKGCYSGTNSTCNEGQKNTRKLYDVILTVLLYLIVFQHFSF
ncbi:hypothetical protein Leryth_007175 [Lithospermum erythrorhizon]|uniref:Uncharacterized protein n=1 Tax=Lithospermum erythrorhizon TaxID=34254 RepID=A0AAV3Q113_LITER|nr:hypothetical protein Leryth_007175 [Lithospermum erythrorhizon]